MINSIVRYISIIILRKIMLILRLFPVKNNRILFQAYSGKRICGSPKCIADKLISDFPGKYEIICGTVDVKKNFNKFPNYHLVKYNSLSYLYYYVTSAVYVTNMGPHKILQKRKGQLIINTWHGGGATKKDGIDRPGMNCVQKVINKKYGQGDVDIFLTSSDAFTKYTLNGAFGYYGKIVRSGLPRNDGLINNDNGESVKIRICNMFGIKKECKIVLFAPTWRNKPLDCNDRLDVGQLLQSLKVRFGDEWVLLYRGHNWDNDTNNYDRHMIDVGSYDEMQDLLLVSDVLITDYSSCAWDFALMDKAIFLYVPDIEEYRNDFSFYLPIEKWGYPYASSNTGLSNVILSFDKEEYLNNLHFCQNEMGMCETGKATETVCDIIDNYVEDKIL